MTDSSQPQPTSTDSALVLVVEDDPGARELYVEIIAQAGLQAIEAHNGFQALEKAVELRPAIVVTDLSIPGLDGFQLCRRLRDDTRTASIPVLGITGRFMEGADVQRAMKDGCRAVLFKPFPPDEFVEAIRLLLNSDSKLGSPA